MTPALLRATVAPYLAQAATGWAVSVSDILGRSRAASISAARDRAIALAKAGTGLSDEDLGEAFGCAARSIRRAIRRAKARGEAADGRHRFVDTLSPNGAVVVVAKRLTDVDRLVGDGLLTAQQRDAATDFAADFALVGYARISRPAAERLDRSPGAVEHARAAHLDRRERVDRAFQRVGGTGTELGETLWHCVGLGCSLDEFRMRRLRAPRSLDRVILALAIRAIAPVYGAPASVADTSVDSGHKSWQQRGKSSHCV